MSIIRKSLLCLTLLTPFSLYATAESPLTPGTIYQYGQNVSGESLSVGNGNMLYVTGDVIDALDGQVSHGASDIFVSAFSMQGEKAWTRVIGSENSDYATASASDAAGNVYITGTTAGAFAGTKSTGSFDVFVAKVAADGAIRWKVQFGSDKYDKAEALTIDSDGNIYLAGRTAGQLGDAPGPGGYDLFLTKLDPTGKQLWTRQFGTADYDTATAVIAIGKRIVVGGYSWGSLDGKNHYNKPSVIIRSYDHNGAVQWTRQFGSARPDHLTALAAASNGDILAAGYSYGNLDGQVNQGDADIFVTRLTARGEPQWTRMLGSDKSDTAKSLAVGSNGNLYLTGYTYGNLDNGSGHGRYDAFTAAWSADGALLDVVQFGGRGFNQGNSIVTAPGSTLFVLGNAASDIDNDPKTGEGRIFLARLGTSAVPATVDTYPPNVILQREPGGYQGYAGDNEDINLSGLLEPREDLNGNGLIDFRSEDRNGDGQLEATEDTDLDGILNHDIGLAEITLSNAINLKLSITSFTRGGQRAAFRLTRKDPAQPASGQLIVRDIAGNTSTRNIRFDHRICATAIDQAHLQDSGVIHIPQWSASPLDEGKEWPDYTLWITGVDHPELFSQLPTVSYPSWSLEYRIKPGAVGSANVRYEVVDYATGGKAYYCGEDHFKISVLPLVGKPTSPEPAAPALVAISGIKLPIELLATESLASKSVTAVGQPLHGTVTTRGNIATYQSDPRYTGSDRFSYWVKGSEREENAIQVRLEVQPNNSGATTPVAKIPTVVKSDAATRQYPVTATGGGTLDWLLLVILPGLRKKAGGKR